MFSKSFGQWKQQTCTFKCVMGGLESALRQLCVDNHMHSILFRDGNLTIMQLFAKKDKEFSNFVVKMDIFCKGLCLKKPNITVEKKRVKYQPQILSKNQNKIEYFQNDQIDMKFYYKIRGHKCASQGGLKLGSIKEYRNLKSFLTQVSKEYGDESFKYGICSITEKSNSDKETLESISEMLSILVEWKSEEGDQFPTFIIELVSKTPKEINTLWFNKRAEVFSKHVFMGFL